MGSKLAHVCCLLDLFLPVTHYVSFVNSGTKYDLTHKDFDVVNGSL